jgi:hypothetical protein
MKLPRTAADILTSTQAPQIDPTQFTWLTHSRSVSQGAPLFSHVPARPAPCHGPSYLNQSWRYSPLDPSDMSTNTAEVNKLDRYPHGTPVFPRFVHPSVPARKSKESRFQDAIACLHLGCLSPIDLLLHILDPSNSENDRYRTSLYKEDGRLAEVMNTIMGDERGRWRLGVWMSEGPAIESTCAIIDREMDVVQKELSMKLEDVTPEYISKWTVETAAGLVARNSAPTLYRLLVRAAQTDKVKTKNIWKKPDMVCLQP